MSRPALRGSVPGERLRGVEKPAAGAEAGDSPVLAYRLYLMLVVMTLLNIPSRLPILGMIRPTLVFVGLITIVILAAGSGP
ncbi:MAG: hypothetical protein FJ170_02875, partial [Gammaproteobacteria bacterium]|nr:hypothetical protein [Gammaproteobacteria bacterium]